MQKLLYSCCFLLTTYTQYLYLSHNLWNLTLKQQNDTLSLQNHALIICLWFSFQFHKTLFCKTQQKILYVTQKSYRNYYGKGFCKCLLLRCVFNILDAVLHFARDVRDAASFYSIFTQVPNNVNSTVVLQAGLLKNIGDVATVLLDLVCLSLFCFFTSFQTDWRMMRSDLCVEHWLSSDSLCKQKSHWIITINVKMNVW